MQSLTDIVKQIKEAETIAEATSGKPETKLRELVSPIWERFLKEKRIGLNLQIREEVTLANGRADTVFNKLILEYKKPKTIKSDNAKNRRLISQVQGYIDDLAEKERFKKQRLLGVAFDGNYFLYMRYAKRWIVDEPLLLSEKSLELFLKNLEKLTSKAALIPENLIRDFAVGRGSKNKVAVDCIKAFYNEINQHGDEGDTKEHVFFDQWKIQFAEVHGSLEQKKIDKKTLFTSYGFAKKEQIDFNVEAFFFSLDSYYALLMKLLAYQVVGFYALKDLAGLPLLDWEKLPSDDLCKKCEELEEGGIFRSLDIRNFLEGDLFSWYTQAWNNEIYKAIVQIIRHLNDYDPETMEVAPDETRDILKKLYQYLVPKQIRHDLGEYYTPDWLADRCLNQLNYNGDPQYRILDPGCGSGTFPILAIKRAKEYGLKHDISPQKTLQNILRNIFGFDLNPLAVISARTNYMLAIADLLKYKKGDITIPIYLCDSINPPQARVADEMTFFPKKIPYEVPTTVGRFYFSHSIVTKRRVQQLANIMEDCIATGTKNEDFMQKVRTDLRLSKEDYEESELYLEDTYDKLVRLQQRGINGVWSRIMKNAFAPLFVGQFDIVAGNPPWVNWQSLPDNYRDDTKPLWIDYGLFSLKGHEARLGGGKKDISMLMTYVSIDKYLKQKGRLCFVITQTLFKTQGAGDGFRRFQLGEEGGKFKVHQVDDMVQLKPFEGATNRTAVVLITKGQSTSYPLSYVLWRKKDKGTISMDFTFEEVTQKTIRYNQKAIPVGGEKTSPWMSAKLNALNTIKKVVGSSSYEAHAGCYTGGLNGVYWIEIVGESNGRAMINNLWNVGRKEVAPVEYEIEKDLIFPLLRGRELTKWFAESKNHIIVPQDPNTRIGYPEELLCNELPNTYKYFKNFESDLWTRKSSSIRALMERGAFYSMFAVSDYTFAAHKLVWKGVSSGKLICAVISAADVLGEKKPIVPHENITLIAFENIEEGHFVCALLNSNISSFVTQSTSALRLTPFVLDRISVPLFDRTNSIHQDLSYLSQQCHKKTESGIDVFDLEEQIDELSAEIWGLTSEELQDIKDDLEELR